MKFNLFVRRLHLYLGMFLLPWFFMYGVSSIPFSHAALMQEIFGKPEWTTRFERPYEIEVPPGADLRRIGARVMSDNGLTGNFGAYRAGEGQLNVYVFSFWTATQANYSIAEKRLVVRDRTFRLNQFLTGMHARGGFDQDSFLADAWAVTVDVVCVGLLLWIASGVYMWWKLRPTRFWGLIALGGGVISFTVFLLRL